MTDLVQNFLNSPLLYNIKQLVKIEKRQKSNFFIFFTFIIQPRKRKNFALLPQNAKKQPSHAVNVQNDRFKFCTICNKFYP